VKLSNRVWIVIAVHSAIVENGLQRYSSLVVSHHHTVILTNSRRLDEEEPVVLLFEKAL